MSFEFGPHYGGEDKILPIVILVESRVSFATLPISRGFVKFLLFGTWTTSGELMVVDN